jgi:hypothetical protein
VDGALITAAVAEFGAALSAAGKLAGLDVGTKTIGLAICDSGWHFAGPAQTIRRTKFAQDLGALRAFVQSEHITGLVVGQICAGVGCSASDEVRKGSGGALCRDQRRGPQSRCPRPRYGQVDFGRAARRLHLSQGRCRRVE